MYFYVNQALCYGGYFYANKSVSSCFDNPGNYAVTFQSQHTYGSYGISFKLLEKYECPSECFDCIGNACCSANYTINNSSCINSTSNFIQDINFQDKTNIKAEANQDNNSIEFISFGLILALLVFICTIYYFNRKNNQKILENSLGVRFIQGSELNR